MSNVPGVGDAGDMYDVVGKRGEKACRPRHKREESALNITELRSNDDDIQGRGAWSFRSQMKSLSVFGIDTLSLSERVTALVESFNLWGDRNTCLCVCRESVLCRL